MISLFMLKSYQCAGCNRQFTRQESQVWSDNVYCNRKCYLNHARNRSKHLVKKWGDIRQDVLRRDKNKCTNCNFGGSAENPLSVHHIDGSGDLNLWEYSNNEPSNLTTLCNKCHIRLHVSLWTKEWGKKDKLLPGIYVDEYIPLKDLLQLILKESK